MKIQIPKKFKQDVKIQSKAGRPHRFYIDEKFDSIYYQDDAWNYPYPEIYIFDKFLHNILRDHILNEA